MEDLIGGFIYNLIKDNAILISIVSTILWLSSEWLGKTKLQSNGVIQLIVRILKKIKNKSNPI